MAANLNLGSNKIVNLATPTTGTDAATKAYADSVTGTPGGSSGQVQYNNSGAFGGRWFQDFGSWSPLVTGGGSSELIFDDDGNTIAVFTGA
jgi:hypothetical protein